MNEQANQKFKTVAGMELMRLRSTIMVHDLIGIFVHASAVLHWSAGSVRLTRATLP